MNTQLIVIMFLYVDICLWFLFYDQACPYAWGFCKVLSLILSFKIPFAPTSLRSIHHQTRTYHQKTSLGNLQQGRFRYEQKNYAE